MSDGCLVLVRVVIQLLSHVPLLWPHGLQHARLPCPLLSPRACWNSCPLIQWCHPPISSSVVPFSSCPQSFPVSITLALLTSIADDWTTKAFAICLYRDWTPCCYSCWPSTTPEGVQGAVRLSVLQGIWWDRSLDSWMFLGIDFMMSIFVSPLI